MFGQDILEQAVQAEVAPAFEPYYGILGSMEEEEVAPAEGAAPLNTVDTEVSQKQQEQARAPTRHYLDVHSDEYQQKMAADYDYMLLAAGGNRFEADAMLGKQWLADRGRYERSKEYDKYVDEGYDKTTVEAWIDSGDYNALKKSLTGTQEMVERTFDDGVYLMPKTATKKSDGTKMRDLDPKADKVQTAEINGVLFERVGEDENGRPKWINVAEQFKAEKAQQEALKETPFKHYTEMTKQYTLANTAYNRAASVGTKLADTVRTEGKAGEIKDYLYTFTGAKKGDEGALNQELEVMRTNAIVSNLPSMTQLSDNDMKFAERGVPGTFSDAGDLNRWVRGIAKNSFVKREFAKEEQAFMSKYPNGVDSNGNTLIEYLETVAPSITEKAIASVDKDIPDMNVKTEQASNVPTVGMVQGGYIYVGGNPKDPNSWVKQR